MFDSKATNMLKFNDIDVSTHIDRFGIPPIPSHYQQLIHPLTAGLSSRENPLPYRDGSLYLLLSLLPGQGDRWHWSLFMMLSHPYGQLYQVVATTSAACQGVPSAARQIVKGRWIFCEYMTAVIVDERAVILALEIARDLAEDDIGVLDEVVKATRVGCVGEWNEKWGEEFSCRVWIKEVLENLRMVAEKGKVVIVPGDCSIADLVDEATLLAKSCMASGQTRLLTSRVLDG